MPVIIEKKLAQRIANKSSFLHNDICIGALTAYKITSSIAKLQLYTGYRGLISGLNVMPCAIGDAFTFLKTATQGDGPFPGFIGRVLSVNMIDNSFEIGFDMGLSGSWDSIDGAFSLCSPVEMGLLGMFSYAAVSVYTDEVPTMEDDLDLRAPACVMTPLFYEGAFDPGVYDSHIKMSYSEQDMSISATVTCEGEATQDGIPTWVRLSTYCRERTSLTDVSVVRYSIIIPVQGNPGVVMASELVTGQSAIVENLSVRF